MYKLTNRAPCLYCGVFMYLEEKRRNGVEDDGGRDRKSKWEMDYKRERQNALLYSADVDGTAAYHSPLTRKENLTLHIHTHLCLQGTCKLEVEGCHLWLNRQKYNHLSLSHTQYHTRFKAILYKCDCTDCSISVSWLVKKIIRHASCWHQNCHMPNDHITIQ